MDEKITRLSSGFRDTGFVMIALGFLGFLVGVVPPLMVKLPTASHAEGAATCTACSLVFMLPGIPMVVLYYSFYKVASGYTLITNSGRLIKEGFHFGIKPSAIVAVANERRTVQVPRNEKLLELDTPDGGILGVAVAVSYSPDFDNRPALRHFQDVRQLDMSIENRIRGALNTWIMQKPLPGTLKRALSMQNDAEKFIIGKLTGTSEALVLHDDTTLYLDTGFRVNDLGIRIHEVNILVMRPLESGTGKPDWGDGDETVFNAQSIFKQFNAHADNLSNLRKLKEALLERYPDEYDDIEDIYDQVRISMKENRG